jgi:hypothetical protein
VRATAALFAAALLGAVACGQGPQPAPAGSQQVALQVLQRFSQCVRDHGVADWPDPRIDDHGILDYPPGTEGTSHLPRQVQNACNPILNNIPANARIGVPSPRPDLVMLRRFARCMRSQGFEDWPDPEAGGAFNLPADLQLKTSPRAPQIDAAMNGACARYNPSGTIQVAR